MWGVAGIRIWFAVYLFIADWLERRAARKALADMRTLSALRLIETALEPSCNAPFRSRNSWTNSSINSLSMKSRKVGRGSISVPSLSPKAVKANEQWPSPYL
jgi:hypothetical protein